MPHIEQLAALVRVAVTHETMRELYRMGVVRPEQEAEDLASALARLTCAAVNHDLRFTR